MHSKIKNIHLRFNTDNYYEEISDRPPMWKLSRDVDIVISFKGGMSFTYKIDRGYETNFRTGPKWNWVDRLVPRKEPLILGLCWLIHDANYEGHLEQFYADYLLYQMLLYSNELNTLTCFAVFRIVQAVGFLFHEKDGDNKHMINIFSSTESYKGITPQLSFDASIRHDENFKNEEYNDKIKAILTEMIESNDMMTEKEKSESFRRFENFHKGGDSI